MKNFHSSTNFLLELIGSFLTLYLIFFFEKFFIYKLDFSFNFLLNILFF